MVGIRFSSFWWHIFLFFGPQGKFLENKVRLCKSTLFTLAVQISRTNVPWENEHVFIPQILIVLTKLHEHHVMSVCPLYAVVVQSRQYFLSRVFLMLLPLPSDVSGIQRNKIPEIHKCWQHVKYNSNKSYNGLIL